MTPVFLAAALAAYLEADAWWLLFPLIVIASLFVHAGTNLISDYYDFRKGVDRPDTYGGSRVLVEKLLLPRQVLVAGVVLFAITALIGLFFIAHRGVGILIIGLIGLIGGGFYTLSKRLGIGDPLVFILMGPLMVVGAFFVLTGDYSHYVLLASLPVGCLVAAILSANNLRDIPDDTRAGIRSTAILLGHRLARWEYSLMVLGAYFIAAVLLTIRVLPLWSLLVFLTLPLAFHNIKHALHSKPDDPKEIASLDVRTAKLHLAFGVLLIASVLLGAIR